MSVEAQEFQRLAQELKEYAENDQMPAMHITRPNPGMVSITQGYLGMIWSVSLGVI